MDVTMASMADSDREVVLSIYREGIATGIATFEADVPSWAEWDRRHLRECRLVARAVGHVVGWAALSPVSTRCVYRGVAEVSVYVAASARGKGVGRVLLSALIEESERVGIWTLQAAIFPENVASTALHLSCGFHEVGVRERLGQVNGCWRDVLLLERRSRVVGV